MPTEVPPGDKPPLEASSAPRDGATKSSLPPTATAESNGRGALFWVLGLAAAALVVLTLLLTGGPREALRRVGIDPGGQNDDEFGFRSPKISTVSPEKSSNTAASRKTAQEVSLTLSRFYRGAFLDFEGGESKISEEAWKAFTRQTRERAKRDADSLTLGRAADRIERIRPKRSRLTVQVLLDARGRPQAALARVLFQATGSLIGDATVSVDNRASFLLRPVSGRWLIAAYPSAKTEIRSRPMKAEPGPSSTGGP